MLFLIVSAKNCLMSQNCLFWGPLSLEKLCTAACLGCNDWVLTLDAARDLIYLRTNAVIQCGRGGLERRHIALADLLYRRRLQRVQTLMASVSCWTKRKPLFWCCMSSWVDFSFISWISFNSRHCKAPGHTLKATLLPWQLAAAGEDTGRHLNLKFRACLALSQSCRSVSPRYLHPLQRDQTSVMCQCVFRNRLKHVYLPFTW